MESKQLKFIDYRRKQTITTPELHHSLLMEEGRSGGAYRKRCFSGMKKSADRISAPGVELPIL